MTDPISRLCSRVFDLLEDPWPPANCQPRTNCGHCCSRPTIYKVNAGNMIDVDSHGSDHDDLGNGDLDRALPMSYELLSANSV
jgi:hypothetical protein